jgi:DNA adenine methylase
MKPLLKWAGGKRHIAGELISLFPEDWDKQTYFEPFIGGAALFFELSPKQAVISDVNKRLIGFYQHVREDLDALLAQIQTISKNFDECHDDLKKEYFLNLRAEFNSSDVESLESASKLFALNKLCFNGLYRENSKGGFNVPFGQKNKFPSIEFDDFKNASFALQRAEVNVSDFEATVAGAQSGDFVYFDPPYIPIDLTSSFTSYNANGFTLEDQKRLANLLHDLKSRSIKALCSNSETEKTREIYDGLNIRVIQAPRMVSAKSSGRGLIDELVISNF